ncbi:Hsp20/alpha crystallin family protein [Thermoflavimicrobium daqui]|jgi:HSP20 family protein|uniref:Molecular chaperone n=1 Tax=Thermoflavimicrobium daqui TaxID=2137476 RepID=A0A364K829_9BACL|nr:Hsp20/alpha crystallin family protein [Thermoflavimicrobium daqui]RAL26350.1 molecular chaperone [Thermoflavimicrobium daqui]
MSFIERSDRFRYPLSQLRDELNRTFQRFFDDSILKESTSLIPPINLREEPERYVIEAELPGISTKDVHVEIQDLVITISGEKRIEEKKEENKMHVIESRYGSFSRSITLPQNASTDMITAEHKRGILYIYVPKDQTRQPRKIDVRDDSDGKDDP